MNVNRIIWIVLDSVGIGEARDAAKFGDEGADTLGHTAGANGGLNIPNMVKLGIGNIDGAHNLERCICRKRYNNWALGDGWNIFSESVSCVSRRISAGYY